eukprot:SAG11_NODE_4832_length_1750_cov_1.284504_3_plen_37_part_00
MTTAAVLNLLFETRIKEEEREERRDKRQETREKGEE